MYLDASGHPALTSDSSKLLSLNEPTFSIFIPKAPIFIRSLLLPVPLPNAELYHSSLSKVQLDFLQGDSQLI